MFTVQDIIDSVMNPSLLGFIVTVLLVITIPLFLHNVVFRASGLTQLPSILLIGPSGSGKTSLTTLFERGSSASTHTSQAALTVECDLPIDTIAASNKYRSVNDPSNQVCKKFLLMDTPGHGKLRQAAVESISQTANLRGIIFLVDSAALSGTDSGLREAAEYLHDALLKLQKLLSDRKTAKSIKEMPLLIAANKLDLFTALPAALVRNALENEITKVRDSRAKGLLDSGSAADDEEKDDWLGEMGASSFKFTQMEEFNVYVEVAGGHVLGGDGAEVQKWWSWIGNRL